MGNSSSSLSDSLEATAQVSTHAAEGSVAFSAAPAGRMVRENFTPMTGNEPQGAWSGPPGERFALPTKDGKEIAAMFVDARTGLEAADPPPAGVILFHGNGMTLEDMGGFAAEYRAASVSSLCITLRGYGGAEFGEGSVADDGERGMYLDAAIAVDLMLVQGFVPERLAAHGFSLGGSMAAAAACHHKLGGLVLDHTFTSARAETAHVAKELVGAQLPAIKWIPDFILRGVGRAGFQPGLEVDLGRGGVVRTDGLAAVDKLRSFGGKLVIIYGEADHMMPNSFADDFEAAYAGEVVRIAIPGGGHDAGWLRSHEAVQKLRSGLASVLGGRRAAAWRGPVGTIGGAGS